MHPDVAKLIELQKLDVEMKGLREEREAVPRHLAGVAARSAAAQGEQVRLGEAVAAEEKLRRGLESDVRDLQAKMARQRKQMDAVTTTAQAAALEHEIAFLAGEVRGREDAELDSMVRSESFEVELGRAKEAAAGAEATLERERMRGAETTERGQARMKEVDAERARVRAGFRAGAGEVLLGQYDRIAKTRGTAMAEGVDGGCSGCRMKVRPQMWNELRDRGNEERIFTCESCGRMLYWDPARDAPQRKPAEREESIAARIVRSL